MPDKISKMISNLQDEIERDTFNLAQCDHSAIAVKIDELKNFIAKTYEERRTLSGLNE